jgi:ATP-dependent protease HslVU (ClpYQ) peptidase subunit
MNASKKIRKLIEEGAAPSQVAILKDLAMSLQNKTPFNIATLYEVDGHYFDIAMELLKEWRFDHYITSRSKLMEQILAEPVGTAAADAE